MQKELCECLRPGYIFPIFIPASSSIAEHKIDEVFSVCFWVCLLSYLVATSFQNTGNFPLRSAGPDVVVYLWKYPGLRWSVQVGRWCRSHRGVLRSHGVAIVWSAAWDSLGSQPILCRQRGPAELPPKGKCNFCWGWWHAIWMPERLK